MIPNSFIFGGENRGAVWEASLADKHCGDGPDARLHACALECAGNFGCHWVDLATQGFFFSWRAAGRPREAASQLGRTGPAVC